MGFKDVLKEIEDADAAEVEPATPEGDQPAEEDATEPEVKKETVSYSEEVEVDDDDDEPEGDEDDSDAPLTISDDTVIEDPFNPGQRITGRQLKDRMLMQADYTRKTQEISERVKNEVRKALEEQGATPKEIERTMDPEDDFSALDPDDPLVKKIAKLEAIASELAEQNQQLMATVSNQQAERDRELLHSTEERLLKENPILDQEQLDLAGHKYLAAIQRGEAVTYEQVVTDHARKLESFAKKAVEGWKERHRVKPPAEPSGGPAGTPPGKGPTRQQFMEEGLSRIIADEDAELARQAQK